jgi:hypothetical protein
MVGWLFATLLDFVLEQTERFDCSLTTLLDLGLPQFEIKFQVLCYLCCDMASLELVELLCSVMLMGKH